VVCAVGQGEETINFGDQEVKGKVIYYTEVRFGEPGGGIILDPFKE